MRATLFAATLLCAWVCAPASALAEDDGRPPILTPITGASGLSGAIELVDGRVRGDMRAAAAIRVVNSREQLSFPGGGRVVTTRYEFQGTAGVALFDMIELGFHLPVVDYDQVVGLAEEAKTGLDDMQLSAKVSLDLLGAAAIAAYVKGELPTGSATFADTAQVELGLAGTVYLLNERVAVHVNAEFVGIEGGTQAFRYRAGISGIPLSGEDWAVRPFFYAEGIEFEGDVGSDVYAVLGAHLYLGSFLFFEIAGDMRIQEDSNPSVEDEGTSSLRVGMGATFDF